MNGEAEASPGEGQLTIQVLEPHLLEGLRQSVKDILETMVFTSPQSVDAVAEDCSEFSAPVIGTLGFTGTRKGSFVVRTDEIVTRTLAAKMLMMEVSDLGSFQEVADAFGEVVNMVAGNFKNAWVAGGNQMNLATPNVIQGGTARVGSDTDGSLRTCIRVQLEQGNLDIGLHFESKC